MENKKTCPQCQRPFTGRAFKIFINAEEQSLCSHFCAKVMQQQLDAMQKAQKEAKHE